LSVLAVSPAKALRLVPHLSHFDMLFANRAEASALLRRPVETATEALEAGEVLRALGPEQVLLRWALTVWRLPHPGCMKFCPRWKHAW